MRTYKYFTYTQRRDAAENARLRYRREAISRFGGKCQRCGYHKDIRALGFDHVDPLTKAHSIRFTRNWRKLMNDELTKCMLLCANCHRIKTTVEHDIKRGKDRVEKESHGPNY